MRLWSGILGALICLAACTSPMREGEAAASPLRVEAADHERVAIFAGGCFWCIEAEMQELGGVRSVISGYTGGTTADPSYTHIGDHVEAVEVIFDPAIIPYERLLQVFWSNIDPTDDGGQFFDRGNQYRTAIFVLDDDQAQAARISLENNAARLKQPIVTAILPASTFYPAEGYHQDYYLTEPERYQAYKKASRREETLQRVWRGD